MFFNIAHFYFITSLLQNLINHTCSQLLYNVSTLLTY